MNVTEIRKKKIDYKDKLKYVKEFLQDFNSQIARSSNDLVPKEHREISESYIHPLIEFLYSALVSYQPEWKSLEIRYADYAMELDRND